MAVGRICARSVDVIEPNETVQTAAGRMLGRNVGSLVVVNVRREPIGMLTDRDLTIRVLSAAKDAVQTVVGDVMTRDPQVVSETTEVEDVLRIMRSGPYRRLPVVDALGQLVGLVSLDDILDLLSEEFRSIGTLLRHETPEILASA